VLTFSVDDSGAVHPFDEVAGMSIEFTADLGGTGLGDRSAWYDVPTAATNYNDMPTVVLTVEAPEEPTVLVLVEVDSPDGLVFGGEIVDVMEEAGAIGRWNGVLKGDELTAWIGTQPVPLDNYLELLKLGGKITVFATTSAGTVSTSMTMDDLMVFPVTAELGTNGTVTSKDTAVSVTIPRAAILEPVTVDDELWVERGGVLITLAPTPNTPKDQRLVLEPVGQAYQIEFFNWLSENWPFRPGFEPKITIDYSGMDIPEYAEEFVSVRYWDPQPGGDADAWGGRWTNADIINLAVDRAAKTVSFNLKRFGYFNDEGNAVQYTIFSIVVEKAQGRIDSVVFEDAFQYPADPDTYYMTRLAGRTVSFRIVDPGGIDESSIRVYVDGQLIEVGVYCPEWLTEYDRVYSFDVPGDLSLTEGLHTLRIEAWDNSDIVTENIELGGWLILDKTVQFYIDRTAPQVVTHAAQRDGIRWFKSVEGAVAAITIVDEGVGLSSVELQKLIFVDVFKHLTPENTPMNAIDQGNIINYQRKTLVATSKPILECADDYTPDGIDNETWVGVYEGASDERHQAWRASYTIHVGQVADGDTYEVVFYAKKPQPTVSDYHNENAVYLYEDLSNAYLMVWDGANSESLDVSGTAANVAIAGETKVVVVPATQMPDFYKSGLLNITASDPFTGYYQGTFLVDVLGNDGAARRGGRSETLDVDSGVDSGRHTSRVPDEFFVRHVVADILPPVVTLDVPEGIRADALSATISASIVDDASGIDTVALVINGDLIAEKAGPASSLSLDYTFGQGEAPAASNEIKIVAVDIAGNETVARGSLGVQETDGPEISDMTPEGDGIEDATPTIAAAYSDPSGIDLDSVTLTLNGAVMTDATVGASMVSYTPVSPLKAGVTYTVKVSVKDTAGAAAEAMWTFGLETVAPSITDTTPSAVDETGTPVVSARFSDTGTGVNTGSVKLMLDKKGVDAQVTGSSVSYTPADVLATGKHVVDLTVADVAGNVAEHTWEFNVEGTAPTITGVAPSGTISDDMPVLSARYSDAGTGVDLSSVALSLNGEVVDAAVTASQVSYGVQEPLKPGVAYTVAVSVADKAGNVGTDSETFRLESTAPSISNWSPTTTQQSVDVAISANYSDTGSGIDQSTAVMKVDGVVVPATPSASGISYQATGLLAGDHTVYVEVADKFGNVATRSWSFSVEGTPPTIASVEPEGEISEATPTVSASYSDAGTGIDVNSVVLSLNGQILPATVTASSVSYRVLTPLELGVTYQVAVQVADKAGNVASDSSSFSLETDPPEIASEEPTGTVSEDDAASGIMISAELSDDGSGVDPDSVVMWLDGKPVDADATAESVQYMAKGLAYGDHTVRVVAADMLGNTADEDWKFSIDDSTPPTVTVLSPKADAVVGVRPVIKISYADEGSGVDLTSIDVKVDGEPVVATAMAPAKPSGAKVVSAGEASYEVKLSYGGHTLTVVVKDVAGNEATAEVSFIVEGDVLKLVRPHNYPNPCAGDTTITFGLSQEAYVTIRIYDFTATLVATVPGADGDQPTQAGDKVEFPWDGTTDGNQLADGVYFCEILAKTDSETKSEIVKIALVRGE
jgi:hypothetical protein